MQIVNASGPGRDELPLIRGVVVKVLNCTTASDERELIPTGPRLHLEFQLSGALRIRFVEPHPEAKQADV